MNDKNTLTDEQCLKFRQLPCSFNDMVMAIYEAGIKHQYEKTEIMLNKLQNIIYIGGVIEYDPLLNRYFILCNNDVEYLGGSGIKELLENLPDE